MGAPWFHNIGRACLTFIVVWLIPWRGPYARRDGTRADAEREEATK